MKSVLCVIIMILGVLLTGKIDKKVNQKFKEKQSGAGKRRPFLNIVVSFIIMELGYGITICAGYLALGYEPPYLKIFTWLGILFTTALSVGFLFVSLKHYKKACEVKSEDDPTGNKFWPLVKQAFRYLFYFGLGLVAVMIQYRLFKG